MENKYTGIFKTFAQECENSLESREQAGRKLCGFGVSYLDDSLIGITKNDLILIAGRSGQGKSELASHIALSNSAAGKKVHYLALEAEPRELTNRLLYKTIARLYYENRDKREHLDYYEWSLGRQKHLELEYLDPAIKELSKNELMKIFYRDIEFGIKHLESIFASVKQSSDLVVVDHLHYFDLDDDNENRAMREIVKTIRNLVLLHSVPVVLVTHVRKCDKRSGFSVPEMEDVSGSSDIFKIATKFISLAHAPNFKSEAHIVGTYLKVGKCRQRGGLDRFTAGIRFNLRENTYESGYKLGRVNSEGVFEEMPSCDIPRWALRAENREMQLPRLTNYAPSPYGGLK